MSTYDLNVVWPSSNSYGELTKTLLVLQDLGYTTVAINVILSGKIPKNLSCPIDKQQLQSSTDLSKLIILTRVTLILDDSSQNQNYTWLYSQFDLVAIRPLTEKALQSACTSLDVDIISMDISHRLPFFLRHKIVGAALQRGIKFEICYASGVINADARKHIITNSASILRATRKNGIIVSSEAPSCFACRGPYDVVNLAVIWGLDHMRAGEAVGRTAQSVVKNAQLRSHSYKQVVEVVQDDRLEEQQVKKRQSDIEQRSASKKQKT
jgi:ribonuclease P/MRP protein subunit RPP1